MVNPYQKAVTCAKGENMKNDGMPTVISPSPTHKSGPSVERGHVLQESRPLIDVGDRDLPSIMLKAWAALGRMNEPPLLFRQGNRLVGLDGQGDIVRLADVDMDGLTRHLARAALWWDVMRGRSEYPPTRVVRCMLAEPNPPLPPLQRIRCSRRTARFRRSQGMPPGARPISGPSIHP